MYMEISYEHVNLYGNYSMKKRKYVWAHKLLNILPRNIYWILRKGIMKRKRTLFTKT